MGNSFGLLQFFMHFVRIELRREIENSDGIWTHITIEYSFSICILKWNSSELMTWNGATHTYNIYLFVSKRVICMSADRGGFLALKLVPNRKTFQFQKITTISVFSFLDVLMFSGWACQEAPYLKESRLGGQWAMDPSSRLDAKNNIRTQTKIIAFH